MIAQDPFIRGRRLPRLLQHGYCVNWSRNIRSTLPPGLSQGGPQADEAGPERLQRDLAEHGVRVGIGRIKRIRKKLGIRCKQKRRFKATTQSRHRLPVAENVLGQQFKVYRPTQCGSQTSHMSPQMRAGCTWQATRTCLPERSWAMPWENG